MKITRDNYEIYFLDYLEGNLDNALVDNFIEFLQQNPDLKEELQLVGSLNLKPDTENFKGKDSLYKEKYDLKKEFEKAAVAYLEGDLILKEKTEFEAYLSVHPEKQQELALFEKTKLQPDNSVVFFKKDRLYHPSKGRTILLWATRVAAVVTVAFFVYRYAGDIAVNQMLNENQVTVSENKNENPEPKSLPEKVEKEKPVPVKENTQVPVKKSDTKTQPHKSLRESHSGRIDHEKVAWVRPPLEVPQRIPALNASLNRNEPVIASLVPVENEYFEIPSSEYEERLLADVVIEKTGLNNLSLNKVAKAGLNMVAGFSKEKFNYETNSDGQITELNFDSRLLAFSIPTNQN